MFKNIVWDYIGKFGNYLVTFLISIVLTRLLSADEFGIMAMVMVIITLAGIFMDIGFNRAIIQQQTITSQALSTVFYINVFAALVLAAACFLAAEPVAAFYNQPLIKPVFQVISISFLLNGLSLVPCALIYRQLKIKHNSIITLVASIISGITGIIMAYTGYGVWSLVFQYLIYSLLVLMFTTLSVKWLPSRQFSIASIKPLWQYGSRMFASGLLDRIYTRVDSIIIGKLYPANMLGYYYRAQSIEGFVRTFSAGGIMGPLFPYIAQNQQKLDLLKQIYIRYLHIITFIAAGISAVLVLFSKDIFTILFTSRWLYAAELFQLMMLAGIVWPISSLIVSMIAGVGNSKNFLKLEVIKKLILLPAYIFAFFIGLKGFIICLVVGYYFCLAANMVFIKKDIPTTFKEQLAVIIPYLLLASAAAFITWIPFYFINAGSPIAKTIIYITLFSFLYLWGAYSFKLAGTEIITKVFMRIKNIYNYKSNNQLAKN